MSFFLNFHLLGFIMKNGSDDDDDDDDDEKSNAPKFRFKFKKFQENDVREGGYGG